MKRSETDLMGLIAVAYPPPAWALLAQVGNATGGRHERWADAVAMSLWPSRGLELHGFEIKSSRSDWLREVASPEKAEPIASRCDRWWIVANEGVVEPQELPATWGLLEAMEHRGKTKLRATREAPKREALPCDRGFLAAILRRSSEGMVPKASVTTLVEAAAIERSKHWCNAHESEIRRLKDRAEEQRQRVEEFETASGMRVDAAGWTRPKAFGAAARALAEAEANGHLDLDRKATALRGLHLEIGRAVECVEQILRKTREVAS